MLAPKRNETPLEYWISLWPTAPMFGVKWRFEALAPGVAFLQPLDVAAQVARASAEEARRCLAEQTEAAAAAVEASLREAAVAAEKFVDASTDAVMVASVLATDPETPEAEVAAEAADVEAAAPAVEAPAPVAVEAAAPEMDLLGAEFVTPVAPATLYAVAPAEIDDLKLIKGVGPKLEAMLHQMGIYRFDQIAGFSPENLAWVDDNLTAFKGRPLRDDWVAQARALL